MFRQAPDAKSVKILTPLVVPSFRGRLIRQNPSESVKIRQFSFFGGTDKTTDLSYVTFRLLRWLFGNGMYFQVARDLRKQLSGPGPDSRRALLRSSHHYCLPDIATTIHNYKLARESKCELFFFQVSHAGLMLTLLFSA